MLHSTLKYLELDVPVRSFCVDSRKILPGDLYCALPGDHVHGESFVEEAFKKGAVYALVSNGYIGENSERVIRVENVLKTLQTLAKKVFSENRPKKVIAITGSFGKTTTKDFIATLLETSFSVFKTPGNANSQIGLTLALLNDFSGEEMAVLEMGMTEKGQLSQLVSMAPPDISVITQVGLVHAENFSSLDAIREAKEEIFLHPDTKIGVYPIELPLSEKSRCSKFTVSVNDKKADFCLLDTEWPRPFNEPHLLHNLSLALGVASLIQVDPKKISEQLLKLSLPEMRMQRIEKKGVIFINDAYNAAPESVIAALQSLPVPKKGRKRIAVLGEMHELGAFSEEGHLRVGIEALNSVDHLICYGVLCTPMASTWKKAGRPCAHFSTQEEIVFYLQKIVEEGDVVLLKGSNSTKMWMIMDKYVL